MEARSCIARGGVGLETVAGCGCRGTGRDARGERGLTSRSYGMSREPSLSAAVSIGNSHARARAWKPMA
eukprot:scaffold10984_cov128-Isochrysis_galbana.AAC.1